MKIYCKSYVGMNADTENLTSNEYSVSPHVQQMVESFNGTLKRMLFKLCNEHPMEWHKMIDPLLFVYREVPNESTVFSINVWMACQRTHANTKRIVDWKH